MRKKALWGVLCAVLCLGFLTSGAFAVTFLNIGTGTTGGTYYPVGAALAKIWSDTIPDVKASAHPRGHGEQHSAHGRRRSGDGLYGRSLLPCLYGAGQVRG